jgi:two-component system, cell cycle response regulator DivK
VRKEEACLKTILIVEDMELNIDLLTQILEEDYALIVARDGAQGVAFARQYKPDLVLMDISLPIMDGYDATRTIRSTFPSLPIIGVSAHAMSGDDEKAIAAGCTDYLTKPIDENLLLKKLKGYLE